MTSSDILISVIIPTYNRRDVVMACLRALRAQTLAPGMFEVLVVDDGSTDGTGEAIASVAPAWNGRLIYQRQANAGANVARNRALHSARGWLAVIINDDSIPIPTFLTEHARVHHDNPDESVAVLGRMTAAPHLPASPVVDLHLDASYAPFSGRTELDWRAFFTCNISAKRSFLLRHGLFDPNLRWHEDVEFGERLRHHGLRVLYNPDALAHHDHYLSEQAFLCIAEKEGLALASWYLRQPGLLDTLEGIGLRTRFFPRFSPRHLLGDVIVNRLTMGPWLWLARLSSGMNKPLSLWVYRAVFQARKRRAIARALADARRRAVDTTWPAIDQCPNS